MSTNLEAKTDMTNGAVDAAAEGNPRERASIQPRTVESRTTTQAKVMKLSDLSLPMSVAEAEAFWQGLAIVAERNIMQLEPMQGAWIVGQHGDMPVAILLKPDAKIGFYAFNGHPALRALPRFTYAAGADSLVETVRCNNPSGMRDVLLWHGTAEQLGEMSHAFFVHHATKARPADKPIESYDAYKRILRTGSAESVANDAFKLAANAVKPPDKRTFGDRWARAALAHVLNEETDLEILTRSGADRLDILRGCNVHRTRNDLVAQGRLINAMFEVEEKAIRLQAAIRPELPYFDAARASLEAFRQAYALAVNGQANEPKPFAQRLVKGLILAQASGARLVIGSLFETVSPALVARYATAWPLMQDVEVVAFGGPSPELKPRKEMGEGAGTFRILDQNGAALDPPRVLLASQEALLNPRAVYHEFQHARQHMAAEGSIYDFEPQDLHAAEVTECQAKQAEAHFVGEFGILY
jgi:hypothetical protein